jgi:hypothetical protein
MEMLSRIMRHPAGLVKKALGRNFLADAFRRPAPMPAAPPDYWSHRYSAPGLVLRPAFRPAPGASRVGAAPGFLPEAGLLPAHAGKASSHLLVSGKPAARR